MVLYRGLEENWDHWSLYDDGDLDLIVANTVNIHFQGRVFALVRIRPVAIAIFGAASGGGEARENGRTAVIPSSAASR